MVRAAATGLATAFFRLYLLESLTPGPARPAALLAARHARVGWWSLLIFLTLGVVLESLHGFKVDWYLSASSHARRLMFTLAHAHGTLLAVVSLAFVINNVLPADPARMVAGPAARPLSGRAVWQSPCSDTRGPFRSKRSLLEVNNHE